MWKVPGSCENFGESNERLLGYDEKLKKFSRNAKKYCCIAIGFMCSD